MKETMKKEISKLDQIELTIAAAEAKMQYLKAQMFLMELEINSLKHSK